MRNSKLSLLALAAALLVVGALRPALANDPTDMYDRPNADRIEHSGSDQGWNRDAVSRARLSSGRTVNQTVLGWLRGNPDYSMFVAALDSAQLSDQFDGTMNYTVFAPTNEAFAKLPTGTWDALQRPENKDLLAQTIGYYYLPGTLTADELAERESIRLSNGVNAVFTDANGGYTIATANVIQPDIMATNGNVQVIDDMLLPPTVVAQLETQGYKLTAYEMNNGRNGVVMASEQTNPATATTGADVYGKCGGPSTTGGCGCSKCGGGCNKCQSSCNKCGGGCNKCQSSCNKCGGGCNKCGGGCNKCGCGGGHKRWHIHW